MNKDREFEQYLQGKSQLTQLYAELPEVELPDHLDAAILAEAHRAVNSRPGAKPGRRWTIPLGMVATLLVAVIIGLQLPTMLQEAASPQQYQEAKIAALMDDSAERVSPAPAERRKVQETARLTSQLQSQARRNEAESMTAPKAVPATEIEAVPAPPAVAAAAPAPVAQSMETRERAAKSREAAQEKKQSAYAGAGMSDAAQAQAPAPAPASVAAPAPMSRGLMTKDEASGTNLTPEDWLARIKVLQQSGKLAAARTELAAFKKRYPDYVVPQALELR